MERIAKSLTELIGDTPLLELNHIMSDFGVDAHVIAKLESFNPGGSVKDRVALSMIEEAERSGVLRPGLTIIEPTSGNTGIGLAWIAAVKGYRLILTMPDSMSIERRKLLAALGATLILTPAAEGMSGAIREAERLHRETPGSFIPSQFDNPANPAIHRSTTAREIWDDTDGQVDAIVAGVGTAGTLIGTARGLKWRNPAIKAFAVEPAESPVLSGGNPGRHSIQGIGAGFIPANYDPTVVDGIICVESNEAAACSRLLARYEGLLAGISSGAALGAAMRLARQPEYEGRIIVAILPDTGDRYLSTPIFDRPE